MKALLGIASFFALCSCVAQSGIEFGGDDGSAGGGGGGIGMGLQPASGLASSSDPNVKQIGDACVKAESDWKQSCGCTLLVMFDLTSPNYTHKPVFEDDQRLDVRHICLDISDNIMRVCGKEATAMCKMSTLNIRRIDADGLRFTMTGSTGNAQMNWDGFHTNMDAISFVLTGSRQ